MAFAVLLFGVGTRELVGQRPAVAVDADDIGGVVTGARGPEAGVWVIAETTSLPTKFTRIVVTDDEGRYVLPDLPKAAYTVWVRGYGLVDSAKVQSEPGKVLNLTAVAAPNARAAAEYYPAQYWLSLLQVPVASEFPGTGVGGNGISPTVKSQAQWIQDTVGTDACAGCHQLGNKATRTVPAALGVFPTSVAAWERRIQSGQAGGTMIGRLNEIGKARALGMYGNWTDRIAAGEYPMVAPPRPQGIERNVVISMWDWADPKAYLHDEISSDKRNPRVNANGVLYGALEASADYLPVADPVNHTSSQVKLEVRDPKTPSSGEVAPQASSVYWGEETIWNSKANAHSLAMDAQARLWVASRVRPAETPAFCREGSTHPSAQAFPINQSNRQVAMYDPKTKKLTTIDTCFGTHHLNFAGDANNTLWFCGGGQVVGWFNTKLYEETKDEARAQGWTVLVLDTNGNGKRDAYVEPTQPIDATKDKRINAPLYGVSPSPLDGSIWGSSTGFPGSVVRLVPGPNPPSTALAEYYEFPMKDGKPVQAFSPRGMDVDRNGVVWLGTSSGHMVSFDRRKCTGPLNGPTATGQHCAEGWTMYPLPGPNYKDSVSSGSADSPYYTFVDRFNMLGVGNNVPMSTGNQSEALVAMVDGRLQTLRVPYPMGFYAKGFDGRIDDPDAGWKGKAIWSTFATRAPFHVEGGKGTTSKIVKFQVRPNGLAK
ncbi:MAG: carboxypeptidase regulatory-like domain-containing protein [Acidobacteria bacterium]|nr:carboxypeptidase regulatory-like domain-containing protein [Acidobacteriota bacterium]